MNIFLFDLPVRNRLDLLCKSISNHFHSIYFVKLGERLSKNSTLGKTPKMVISPLKIWETFREKLFVLSFWSSLGINLKVCRSFHNKILKSNGRGDLLSI